MPPAAPQDWHARSAQQCLEQLHSHAAGLSAEEAERRLRQYGPNLLPETAGPGWFRRLLLQFHNLLIYVLLGAALLVGLLGHRLDALVILGVVAINALVGFIQEGKAEQAMRSIRKLLTLDSRVRRDGLVRSLPAEQLVPGDIVLLEAGDRVPADLRLLDCRDLRIDEAMLTGESLPADKDCAAVAPAASLGDRHGMAYSGTLVSAGNGTGVVVATGQQTELGHISGLLGRVESLQTPLLADIQRFARQLTVAILLLAGLTYAVGVFWRDYSPSEMLMAAVGLAVAAIPEGLPAVLTIVLALGVQRMARHRAIIRRLPAVESLGAVTVICSDKTGTLTRNEMTVQQVFTTAHAYQIGGVGYEPSGSLSREGCRLAPPPADDLLELARAGLLANSASLRQGAEGWQISGDPTEAALLTLAGKLGLDGDHELRRLPRVDSIPFSPELRCTASLHHDHAGHGLIYLFGAPERLLELCNRQLRDGNAERLDSRAWHARLHEGAAAGLRMIGLAMRPLPAPQSQLDYADLEGDFILLGLVGMLDPPREEAIAAIAECRSAGIAVKMITGDHAATAAVIAERLGLGGGTPLTGAEIDQLDDATLDARLADTTVFARTNPAHKLRLVERLQARGERVAMTGDGVNDAPALKRADIGIAMGIKGNESAKEAAQMVLADDNFATLTHAVEEGRTVYDNLRKSILFILPTSGGQSLVLLFAIALGLSNLPITPLQILWVNMITAVTLALALAFEPAENNLMQRPPRDPAEPLLSGQLLWRLLFVGLLLTGASLGLFLYAEQLGLPLEVARTLAVNALVAGEIGYLFCARRLQGAASFGLRDNPMVWAMVLLVVPLQLAFSHWAPLQALFGTAALDARGWALVVACAVAVMLLVEMEKWLLRRRHARR